MQPHSKSMKKLVVVGGGFAGMYIARKMENEFEVTLIDTKDYFEFTPGILRALVKPGAEKNLQVKHSDYLNNAKFILGAVNSIHNKFVIVNGKKIKYDYLALCSGSAYTSPFKDKHVLIASHTRDLLKYHSSIEKSNSIAIVGGGLVGVELAAEIAHYYPHKRLTLIHSKESLIERNPQKARRYALRYLLEKKAWVLLNQLATKVTKNKVETDKKFSFPADVVFMCTGIRPNTIYFDKHFKRCLDKRGFVIVDEKLRVKGTENIFAAGDITNVFEEKTGQNAEKHAMTVVNNIRALEHGKDMKAYNSKKRPIVISLGPFRGIFVYKGLVITGILPGFLKWIIEKREMWRYKR